MKRKKPLFLFLGLLICVCIMSQIPDSFSYQAIIRDSDNSLLINKSVTVEVSILRGEEVIFTQIIEGKTNENGLLSLTIGGTPEFGEIDWTDGQLFIQTRIDPAGGSNFRIETTAQLMSVPYAMAAQKAMNVAGLDLLKEKVNKLEEQVEELHNIVYPIIPFEEYSLEGTTCNWTNLNYDGTVLIINSNEDLANYISCTEGSYPEIDFSQNTILLAKGKTQFGISDASTKIIRQSITNSYDFEVEIKIDNARPVAVDSWQIAVKVQKNTNIESAVNLKISTTEENNSVWLFSNLDDEQTDDIIFDLTFYPSENKIYKNNIIPEIIEDYFFRLFGGGSYFIKYHITNEYCDFLGRNCDKMYRINIDEYGNTVLYCPFWIIYISENEMLMVYGENSTNDYLTGYSFVRQENLNK